MNMIITVIIAIIFLGVAIGLILKWGGMIEEEIPKILPPGNALWSPSADNPVMISPSRVDLKRGGSKVISLEIYNHASSDVECNFEIKSSKDEPEIEFLYAQTNRPIEVGMVGHWDIHVEAGKRTELGAKMYLVNIDCAEFTRQVDLVLEVE
ncbi:MAG: hypothetical protein KKE20_05190 [Nanoarchaeota archaeon]|nr:hypothetical protein [Nanoarchaeota archaeon]